MQIGTQNIAIQSLGFQTNANVQNQDNAGQPSRGERLVARLDQDNDGKLSVGELKGTRLGEKMSVDRFARLDANDDGLLDAGELNRKGRHHKDGPSDVERAMVAKFADLLTERVEPRNLGEEIAKEVLARLDADGSEGLNSEEIAGTRLAEAIGSDFYELDGDKNGALDVAELSAFINDEYLQAQESDEVDEGGDDHNEGDESDEGGDVGFIPAPTGPVDTGPAVTIDPVAAADPVTGTVAPVAPDSVAAPDPAEPEVSSGPVEFASPGPVLSSYAENLRSSFEKALAILQKGNEQQQSTLDVVRALYAEANGTLGET